MLLSAVRESDREPIKVQSIWVLSRFQSHPNESVTAPVIRVLSYVFSRRACGVSKECAQLHHKATKCSASGMAVSIGFLLVVAGHASPRAVHPPR